MRSLLAVALVMLAGGAASAERARPAAIRAIAVSAAKNAAYQPPAGVTVTRTLRPREGDGKPAIWSVAVTTSHAAGKTTRTFQRVGFISGEALLSLKPFETSVEYARTGTVVELGALSRSVIVTRSRTTANGEIKRERALLLHGHRLPLLQP